MNIHTILYFFDKGKVIAALHNNTHRKWLVNVRIADKIEITWHKQGQPQQHTTRVSHESTCVQLQIRRNTGGAEKL